MKKLRCKIGEQFGYWKVIDNTPVTKSGHTYVMVECKCGKQELKCLSDLRNGRTTGCKSCKARERSQKISIGDKYKHWTVIGGPKTNEHNCLVWECQCDCGTIRWMQGNELINPNMSIQCVKCAAKERGKKQAQENGKVGDLKLTRYTKLQRSAEKRGIEFNVTMQELWDLYEKQSRKCAITGDNLPNIEEASLDRIDSNKGYYIGNIQWTTYQANVSKHLMSMNELYIFCKKVLNHANQQPNYPLKKVKGSETNS